VERFIELLEILLCHPSHLGVKVELHLPHESLHLERPVFRYFAELRVEELIETRHNASQELNELLLNCIFQLLESHLISLNHQID
jgi:hypothetical protein